jgi:1-acyl-sn-glycerol-3-phosphate acyltransferase
MEILRAAWSWTAALVLTILFGTGAILTSWVPPRGKTYLFWARSWAKAVLFCAGIPVRIEVSEKARSLPTAILMANHESALDILVLFLAVPQEVRFLAKKSIFYVPFLGWSMWLAGFVPVERERADKAKDVLGELADRIRNGLSVLIFPEGTRSRDGSLHEFKKSGFLLALKSGIPIVPIGISGSRPVLGARGLIIGPGEVVVRVGDPVPTEGLGVAGRRPLMAAVRSSMARLSGR